ncbi:MAG: hypothetical protein JWO19_3935 [Bryobacterales bacterium]|jgi:hypothetical protein|nr:hypothetical protein [Bryobacterales bacterium]
MRLIASHLRRLEKVMAPARLPQVVVRFEGPGSEKFPKPNEDARCRASAPAQLWVYF